MVTGTTVVLVTCPFCGKDSLVRDVPIAGLLAWEKGELIQKALPELSAEDRELVKTGICDRCWPKDEE